MQHLQNWLQDLTLIKLCKITVVKLTKWIAQSLQMNETIVQLILARWKIFYFHHACFDKKHTWKVYRIGVSLFQNLVAEKLTLAFTMDVCSTEIYQKCPNFVKTPIRHFSKQIAWWILDIWDESIHSCQWILLSLSIVSIFKDRDFIRIWSSK